MDATTEVFDPNGERIVVGSRVKTEWHDDEGEHAWLGTVKIVTDPDGDTDEEGRMYGINPSVHVQWDDADENDTESFSTTANGGWHDRATGDGDEASYECEDLEVVK